MLYISLKNIDKVNWNLLSKNKNAKLYDYKMDVGKVCDGEKTDFQHDFVRKVCSQTINKMKNKINFIYNINHVNY